MLLRKRLISMLTALACMISVMCVFGQVASYSSNVNAVSTLTGQSATDITSQMTIGWNLGNSLDSYNASYDISVSPKKFATCWGNPEPTKELLETVKNAGFNTVRIPTTWFQHLAYNESTDTYEIDPTWLAYVKQTVDYAYDMDLFIILNMHHEDFINATVFTDETLAEASHKLKDIWTQLSEEFKDYDQKLIFEGMNEPRQTGNPDVSEWGNGSGDNGYTWNYVNTLNEIFINTVRSNGSTYNNERLLMIPGYVASSDTTALNAVTIPEGSGNVALSVHAYAPYFFTMDTSEYSNHTFPGKSGWGEDYETSLKTLFTKLKSVSDNKGVPVIIGEFSASDFENTADRVEWAKCYLSNAKEVGIPCVLWDNNESANGTGEAHGYIYRLTNTIYPNSADVLAAMMDTVGVTNYVLPEYEEYQAPKFSWSNIPVADDWVELYKSETGETLKVWDNMPISNWQDYINENYMLALVYDSNSQPEIVLQGGWYRIMSDDDLNKNFISYFTYQDIMSVLNTNEVALEDMENLYISATSSVATMYGLYAIPLNSSEVTTIEEPVTSETTQEPITSETTQEPITSETTQEPVTSESTYETTTSTEPTDIVLGDTNSDGTVKSNDLLLLKKYLLGLVNDENINLLNSDINQDGNVKSNDLLILKKNLLGLVELA